MTLDASGLDAAQIPSPIDGRYRVLSRLGSGGMADVYLAEDETLGRDAALQESRRDRPCAGAEFDNRAGGLGIDIARHHARQKAAGGRDGPGDFRIFHPRLEEPGFVAQTFLQRSLLGAARQTRALHLRTQTRILSWARFRRAALLA